MKQQILLKNSSIKENFSETTPISAIVLAVIIVAILSAALIWFISLVQGESALALCFILLIYSIYRLFR